jgi:hypothetical protein
VHAVAVLTVYPRPVTAVAPCLLPRCHLQAESSEDDGPAAADDGEGSGGQQRGGVKSGGRELKRLQMWAWERRNRDGSSGEEDEEDGKDSASGKGHGWAMRMGAVASWCCLSFEYGCKVGTTAPAGVQAKDQCLSRHYPSFRHWPHLACLLRPLIWCCAADGSESEKSEDEASKGQQQQQQQQQQRPKQQQEQAPSAAQTLQPSSPQREPPARLQSSARWPWPARKGASSSGPSSRAVASPSSRSRHCRLPSPGPCPSLLRSVMCLAN